MKKKIALFLSSMLALTAMSVFAGCKNGDDSSDSQPQAEPTKIVLSDFETFEPDFQLMRLMNGFGAVEVNTDKTYVKSGETSAKILPLGRYSDKSQPYFYVPLQSERFAYDYTDFTYYENISMWMYNASAENKIIKVGLITDIGDVNVAERAEGKIVSLKAGWNKIVYKPDLNLLNIMYDVTDIKGLYLEFEHTHSRELSDAPVYYLDDIVISSLGEQQSISTNLEFDEGEIINFEKEYQRYGVAYDVSKSSCIPELKVVSAKEEGVSASSGEYMLKVVTKPGESDRATWPRIVIPEKIIRSCGYMNIPEDQWGNYKISFDVYAVTAEKEFYPEFYGQGGANIDNSYNVKAKVGEWRTFSVKLSDIRKPENLTNPGKFAIAWGEYVGAGETTFYFDNFRYEAIS